MDKEVDNGNMGFELAKIMDIHKIVYMWIKMRDEFIDPIGILLDRDQKESEIFYMSLVGRICNPQIVKSNVVVLATYKKEPIGFGLGNIEHLDNSSHWIGYCREIYVKDRFRKRGVEISIRSKIIGEFKKRNVSKVLYVVDYNEKELEIYKKRGFTPIKITFAKEEVG